MSSSSRSVVTVGSRIIASARTSHPELPDIGGRWRDDVAKPVSPALQRLALLGSIGVNVVDRVDALLLMAEDQLGDEGRDAERCQIGARAAAQIVEAPIGQPGRCQFGGPRVNGVLELAEAFDWSAAALS